MFISFLNALVSLPKLGEIIDGWITQIVLWRISRCTKENLSNIADAAAFANRAKTDEDRYAASQKWQDAFSHPRVTS